MIIKPSAMLQNNYSSISKLAKESEEPIYITKNGEGDGVFMSIEAFERREQLLDLCVSVLEAEEEWIVNTFLDNFYENILNSTGFL